MKCSICKKDYTGWGNNAEPVNSGRCCDDCNWISVVPARLGAILKDRPKVGDVVEFQIGEETMRDQVTYVMGHVVEGKTWDLTYVNFKIVK